MITPKAWGYEDEVINVQEPGVDYCCKRMYLKEQHRCSIHQHKIKDEVLMVGNPEGLMYFEIGDDPAELTGQFLEYPGRIRVKPGQWHRFTGLRDTFIIEASTHHEDSDSYRHIAGGKLADEPFKHLLRQYFKESNSSNILTPEAAKPIAELLHSEGRLVGMCNGCFDLMHLGHAVLLEEAKARCEVLFVAVNTDDAVSKLKGPDRPFIDQKGRIGMVASNRNVDYVVICDEETCLKVVAAVRPSVYVTTSEYGKSGPEAKEVMSQGGVVEVVGMIPTYKTTNIARTISQR